MADRVYHIEETKQNDENADININNDNYQLPPPTKQQLESCKAKNSLLIKDRTHSTKKEERDENINPKYGTSWKETVQILQQRLTLAYKMKQKALNDAQILKQQIDKQDIKLSKLQSCKHKLSILEQRYKSITNENKILRQEILQKTTNIDS